MLRPKCSYEKDIKTCKKAKKQRKNRNKVCSLKKKQVKAKFPPENADIWWLQLKNVAPYAKRFFTFMKVFNLLSMCAKI